jgi:uncharacterized repeat protein (TIGR01451 family)
MPIGLKSLNFYSMFARIIFILLCFFAQIGYVLAQCPATVTATNTGPYYVGQTISLTSTATNASKWSWTGPSSFASTLQNPTRPTATLAMGGTYSVTVTEALGPEIIAGGQFTSGTTIPGTMATGYLNSTDGNGNGNYYVQANAGTNVYGDAGCLSGGPSGGGFFCANGANVTTTTLLEQTTIPVVSGNKYRFSVWVGNVFTSANTPIINVFVNGVLQTTLTFASGCNWQNYTVDFTAASSNATIRFVDTRNTFFGAGDVVGIDDISLKQVYTCSVSGSTAVTVNPLPVPGGVSAGLQIWLKADVGTTATSMINQATGGGTLTQSGTGTTLNTNAVNFNPALSFNSNGRMEGDLSTQTTFTTGSGLTSFAVNRKNLFNGSDVFFTMGPVTLANSEAGSSFYMESPSLQADGTTFYLGSSGIHRENGSNDFGYRFFDNASKTGIYDIVNTKLSPLNEVLSGYDTKLNGFATTYSGLTQGTYTYGGLRTRVRFGGRDNDFFNGLGAEAIVYNVALTDAEELRVSSYLAIKYGKTLGLTSNLVNYVASDGATIYWTGNATYQNNIAGIARDDASALSQKQSKSVNTGLQVVVGNGNTIATDNATNTTTFSADKSALVWGDNNASVAAWTATGAPAARQIVARMWKVQETGTVGSVKLQIADNSGSNGLPAETTTVYLLVDADGDFTTGAIETAMTLNGTNWEANVDLTTGQFFTFATQLPPAPGGVASNLYLWLKADGTVTKNGTNQVSQWTNQSSNAMTTQASRTADAAVVWTNNIFNFNPAITYSGVANGRLSGAYTTAPASPPTIFGVSRLTGAVGPIYGLYSGSPAGAPGIYSVTDNAYYVDGSGVSCSPTAISTNVISLVRANYSSLTSATGAFTALNGTTNAICGSGPLFAPTTLFEVGGRTWGGNTSRIFAGNIGEMIYFNGTPNATQTLQIESYLAIKYGITKANEYIASDGSTIYWTAGGSYQNNITGIARDDASALSQKQSKSVNTGLQVVVGNGSTIATDNASNTSVFTADKSALVWGDNAGSVAAWTTTGAPIARQIIARKWKVQETGIVGTVKVQVADNSGANGLPAENTTVYMLVDADGDFTSGATELPMTLSGTNWEANVNLVSGQFFTFATSVPILPVTLTLAMTSSATTVSSTNPLVYTLTLANTSANIAYNVKVKDQIPPGVTIGTVTPSIGTWNTATGIWTIPILGASPATATLTINTTVQ